ncbi:DNA sulfur modification protein DndB [Aliarcobacter butzleri]|uniref:DNA sulfur modification protein DndB n=1 Tax=Aliarcobacter butzleri TaxID=28197 RepID=UPI00344DE635
MPTISAKFLGLINENAKDSSPVVMKRIIKVKASELAQWFQYSREKKGGRNPFKVLDSSIIQIHERVQRGKNESGFVLQEKTKIDDIKENLLGIHKTDKKTYLGSLVWNIRKIESNKFNLLQMTKLDGSLPEYILNMEINKIYLTDSAHRHFGIVEAYKEYQKNPTEYPLFNENFEFLVEIYNLTIDEEQNLFNELNSKQKKITAAKQKELDNSTPLGKIKDEIIDYDMEHERIFYNNIELNSNQNNRHTLMTMSVFVASIKEMFKNEIDEVYANDTVNDELKDEIVSYYCDFFSQLRDTIKIKYLSTTGEEKQISPFENLYMKYIYVVENADFDNDEIYENKLEEARNTAKIINSRIREQDLITHNITIKALSRLGKLIRKMSNWKIVIEQIQQSLIIGYDGKFLQKNNNELFEVFPGNQEALVKFNEDGTLNMQVVSWKVNELFNYLIKKLNIEKETNLFFEQDSFKSPLINNDKIIVSQSKQTTIKFKHTFFIADNLYDEITTNELTMSIMAVDGWSKIKFVGKTSIKAIVKDFDEGFIDEIYDKGIRKTTAIFEVTLPPFEDASRLKNGLRIKIKSFNISFDNEIEYILNTTLD